MIDPQIIARASVYPYWLLDMRSPKKTIVKSSVPEELPLELHGYAESLVKAISDRLGDPTTGRAFAVDLFGTRFRIQIMGGGAKATARLIQRDVPELAKLRLGAQASTMMISDDLRVNGGLVIFSGPVGSGKTTTAMATIHEQLSRYGGFCLTIEDPVEFPKMAGFHNGGYCEQIVAKDQQYLVPLREALRCFPPKDQGLLFVGEIRDSGTAAELLRASIAGHLVLTTIHADDPVSALQRLLSLASANGEEQARSLLASSIKCVLHQELHNNVPRVRLLDNSNSSVSSRIMSGGDLNLLREQVAASTPGRVL